MPGAPVTPLAGAIAAEADSFEHLYRSHHGFVWRCLYRLGVPEAGVEDALQEVFVTAYRRMGTFEGRASVRAWLGGIARKVAFRHRRTVERHARRKDALARVPTDAGDLEDWMRCREADAFLDAFLGHLDEDKRAVFVLCDLEGMRGREAAEALGVNANTAAARLRAARQLFHQACDQARIDGFPGVADDVARVAAETQPPAGAAQRSWAAMGVQLASGGGVAAASSAGAGVASSAAAAPAVGITVAKGAGVITPLKALVVSMALGGAGAVATTTVMKRRAATEEAPVAVQARTVSPRPVAAEPVAPPPVQRPVPKTAVPAEPVPPIQMPSDPAPERAPVQRTTATPVPDPVDPLTREMDLVDAAREAENSGNWTVALNRSRTYRRDHAGGAFVHEATRIEVRALCELGKRGEASDVATAVLGATRGKLLVDRTCPR